MDLDVSPADAAFREEVRGWLRENGPREKRPRGGRAMRDFDTGWQRTQFEGGWAGINWPTEFGGRGLSLLQQVIWYEEYAAARPPGHRLVLRRQQPRRPHADRPRHRGAEGHPPPADPGGRGGVGPGVQRARGRLRPRLAADQGRRRRRRARRHRAEGVDQLRGRRRLPGAARPHQPRRPEAQGDHVGDLRHAQPRHRDPPARHDRRRAPLRRGLLRRGAHPAHQRGRRRRRRLVGGDVDPLLRTGHGVHGEPDQAARDRRAARRPRPRNASSTTTSSPAGWRWPGPRSPPSGP